MLYDWNIIIVYLSSNFYFKQKMATVWEREQIAKKDAKKSKANAAKQEKDAAQQAKVNEEFNEKQAAASSAGDTVA